MTQITCDTHQTPALGIIERIRNATSRSMAYLRARASLHELQLLDDRMLDDIGISRDDLTWAEYLPTSRNPISELARCRRKNVHSANNGQQQVRRCS